MEMQGHKKNLGLWLRISQNDLSGLRKQQNKEMELPNLNRKTSGKKLIYCGVKVIDNCDL